MVTVPSASSGTWGVRIGSISRPSTVLTKDGVRTERTPERSCSLSQGLVLPWDTVLSEGCVVLSSYYLLTKAGPQVGIMSFHTSLQRRGVTLFSIPPLKRLC